MPARVPDGLIDTLKGRDDPSGLQVMQPPDFGTGDDVRIVEGPMAGSEGISHAKTGQRRVVVLLEIVARSVRGQLATGRIEPSSS